ncbi:MAG: GDP-mannose 4,6-dehydratase [Candidatus Micrarchaeia archaeon]|jgi:UDP-glucose 4-epimerase
MAKYLVTGGAGFIGSHIVEALLSRGDSVTAIDNFDAYYDVSLKRENIANAGKNKNFRLVEGDIRDQKKISDAMNGVDVVIHEAAQPGVSISVKDPLKTVDMNVVGTTSVLDAARKAGVKKIVFASSSSVYGKVEYLPFDEKHPINPISPYGVSKMACEHLCRVFSELYGIAIPQLRYFTVYGPRMRPDLAINIFTRKALKNEEIVVYGNGTKSRSFTYVSDVVDATLLAAEKGKTGPYNIGGEHRVTMNELLGKIMKISKSKSKIAHKEDVKGDVEHTMAKNDKAKAEFGWKPKVGIDEGLEKYVEWVKERPGK